MAKGKYQDWLTPDGLLLLEGWAREGLTDEQIAKNMGINIATLYRWKADYCDICDAIKKGKAPVDFQVENALLKSALGFTQKVRKPIKVRKETQKAGVGKVVEEKIEYVEEEVYIPPSNTAQIFWLKNRRPDKWRDKQEVRVEQYEDDGLTAALAKTLNESGKDDSSMIPEESNG